MGKKIADPAGLKPEEWVQAWLAINSVYSAGKSLNAAAIDARGYWWLEKDEDSRPRYHIAGPVLLH
jgi:hypothetical protein